MEARSVVTALQDAVDAYNDWAAEKGAGYNIIGSYNDLRGIFYNKLAASLYLTGHKRGSFKGGYRYSSDSLLSNMPIQKVNCKFIQGGYLQGIEFTPSYTSTLAIDLVEASRKIIFERDPYLKSIKEAYRRIASF